MIQWRIQGRVPGSPGPPPYFQTNLRTERPKKIFFGDRVPLLSKGLDDGPHPTPRLLSQGMDPELQST